ncbi:hypothetical protein HK104_007557 [Borealophlyctis nickersoniae]|nr:hypothetical protein HK104_007557 [Borealophlyctis nickersoniae]
MPSAFLTTDAPRPRRVYSTPNFPTSTSQSISLLSVEQDDPDAEWIVPSVRAKAQHWREKAEMAAAGEAEGGGCTENWDDDFELEGGDVGSQDCGMLRLEVPDIVLKSQNQIKGDVEAFKSFALHVEDLKLIFLDATDMATGLNASHARTVESLQQAYAADLERARVLIDVGDLPDDPMCSQSPVAKRVLSEILGLDTKKEEKGVRGGADEEGEEGIGERNDNISFGADLVPVLVGSMGPLKARLAAYVGELRAIALAEAEV